MDLDRRSFLQGAVATGAALALPYSAHRSLGEGGSSQAACPKSINDKLSATATALRKCADVGSVKEHLADNPTTGLTQFNWYHFLSEMSEDELKINEIVNAQLLSVMEQARSLPHLAFDELLQEGMVTGKEEEYLSICRDIVHTNVRKKLTVVVPFGTGSIRYPTRQEIQKGMRDRATLKKRVTQKVYPYGQDPQWVSASSLGRAGAGYIFSSLTGAKLTPTEDPELDKKAEVAVRERIDAYTSGNKQRIEEAEAQYQQVVIEKRNVHFVRIIRESKSRMQQLLVGYGHDLTGEITKSNAAHPQNISHIVVRVKGLPEKKE